MDSAEELRIGGRAVVRGALGGREILLVTGGMGKTNAAQALTALLERHEAEAVVGFGVGGAYPSSGLEVADVALAAAEIYADEGVVTPDGWIPTNSIGIPLARVAAGELYNEFPVDAPRLAAAADALRAAGIRTSTGAFATVSTCSGTSVRGAEIADRHAAVCETMEGAAYAHVAALYGLPFLEVRGISNLVEDRDLSTWRLAEAAESAARALEIIVPLL